MDHRFGTWRIATQARELWNGDELQPVARRVFECLAYLIEHRERAVGRDELVAALWGRVDVADVLVSQLIARARKAVGDDATNQRAIRTIPGFGYRWVMPLDDVQPTAVGPATERISSARASAPPAPRQTSMWPIAAVAAMLVVGVVAAGAWWWSQRSPLPKPVASTPMTAAVIVLPFDVAAPREAGWLRLGAMDLVGERLRAAGLAVPSSESVLIALHAQPGGDDAASANAVSAFAAKLVVRGRAQQSAQGWRIELSATDADGAQRSVSAARPQPTDAARQAADLLLAALGHANANANAASENEGLDERLQRVQAAILANEFAAAREILAQADPVDLKDPQLRYRAAQIDFHEGHLQEADAVLRDLLADPSRLSIELQANVQVARGMLAMRRGDCELAEPAYDAGVRVLEGSDKALAQGNALAGRGLARACLRRFDDAASDLGLARTRMSSAGDPLGLARVDNYLGLLDADRNRLADALVDLRAAAATFERFGVIEASRAVLNGQLEVQSELLQHADALATSERLWALRTRIADPGQRLAMDANRARALLGVGRLQAAAEVLSAADADLAAPSQAGYARYVYAQRAELAVINGDREQAAVAARKALADWPARADDTLQARTLLILRRAEADTTAAAMTAPTGTLPAAFALLIQAEAARKGDAASAERLYAQALTTAEADGVPATTVAVVTSYANWLLGLGRATEAAEIGGRIARWADRDFNSALLQVALYRALGRDDLRAASLREAESLAGERPIPLALREAPASARIL